jgi:hypothetical protein
MYSGDFDGASVKISVLIVLLIVFGAVFWARGQKRP